MSKIQNLEARLGIVSQERDSYRAMLASLLEAHDAQTEARESPRMILRWNQARELLAMPKLTAELAVQLQAFDPETYEGGPCLACGCATSLDEREPTPTCHGCAHELLRQAVDKLIGRPTHG